MPLRLSPSQSSMRCPALTHRRHNYHQENITNLTAQRQHGQFPPLVLGIRDAVCGVHVGCVAARTLNEDCTDSACASCNVRSRALQSLYCVRPAAEPAHCGGTRPPASPREPRQYSARAGERRYLHGRCACACVHAWGDDDGGRGDTSTSRGCIAFEDFEGGSTGFAEPPECGG